MAAVTIVRELALRVAQGTAPGVPSHQVIRLCASGDITVEGPVAADGDGIARAAHLLDSLLPSLGGHTDVRVPGALRLIVARALGTLDLPPYASLQEFADSLARFAAPDAAACIRDVVLHHPQPTAEPPARDEVLQVARPRERDDEKTITISDIRRARRATGLTLSDIAARIQIPATMLCELEWGYLYNWPASPAVRRHIVNYARAAGLDDQLVVRTVWPLFEESLLARGAALTPLTAPAPPVVVDAVPVDDDDAVSADDDIEVRDEPAGLATIAEADIAIVPPILAAQHARRRTGLVAAFVIPALIAIGLAPAVWDRLAHADRPPVPAQAPAVAGTTPLRTAPALPPDVDRPVHAVDRAADEPVSGPALSPAFASAGSAAFSTTDAADAAAVVGTRGSILRITSVVDPRARNFHARPSPDGSLVAFDSDRDGERGVYIAGSDGRNVKRVSGDGFAAIPSWSPDGTTLAFVRAEADQPNVWNLWTVDLGSGQTRRLTSHRTGQSWGASWFPDGRQLAYGHEDRLVILDVENGTERVYPSPVKGTPVRAPAVSPDGSRVVFHVDHQGTWLLDTRKGSMRRVMADPTAEEYTWSPDGRRIAYHSPTQGKWGVWVMGNP